MLGGVRQAGRENEESMTASRETFGNIPHESVVLFYWLTWLTVAIFVYGIWRRFRLWRKGVPICIRSLLSGGFRRVCAKAKPGIRRLLKEGLGQSRVRGRG